MKRTSLLISALILVIILSAALVHAQGPGCGAGRCGQTCPSGNLRPSLTAGGWWTKAQPATPEQKAFVDAVTRFHNQMSEKQMALVQLRSTKGDPRKIGQLETEITTLRTQFQDFMVKNQQVRQQLGAPGCGVCCADCPMAGQCPGANGQGCPFGMQCNMSGGGWWTQIQPKTKEQKAFVDTVAGLHTQIRDRQTALMQMRASKGDPRRIATVEQEVAGLQTQLREHMIKNQQMCKELCAPICNGTGPGNCGMMGQCQMRNGWSRGMGCGMGRGACGGGMNPGCPVK